MSDNRNNHKNQQLQPRESKTHNHQEDHSNDEKDERTPLVFTKFQPDGLHILLQQSFSEVRCMMGIEKFPIETVFIAVLVVFFIVYFAEIPYLIAPYLIAVIMIYFVLLESLRLIYDVLLESASSLSNSSKSSFSEEDSEAEVVENNYSLTDQLVDDATDNTLAYVVNHMHNNRTATTVLVPKNHQVSTTKSRAKEIRATKVDVIANERQTAQEYMDSLKCKDDNLGKINGNLIKFGEEIVHKKSGEQEVLKKRKNSFLKKTVEKREIKREIAYTDLSEDFAHDQQAKQIDQQSCDEKLFSKKR